jgi:hypothetical protein
MLDVLDLYSSRAEEAIRKMPIFGETFRQKYRYLMAL